MSKQRPYGFPEEDKDKYVKTLFVDRGMEFEKVKARVAEPYTPPTPSMKSVEAEIISGPSQLYSTGISSYETSFQLIYESRRDYVEHVVDLGNTHKYYDERGEIYLGVVKDIKPKSVEANRRYQVEVTLTLVKKDSYKQVDKWQFQDIEGHWAEYDIAEMANLGLLSVIKVDGEPVLHFRPSDFVTRGEFFAMINRTRRLLERILRT